ncbi:hypothetical protein M0R19_00510 [Candidatus Pacearchaeota archaeon]|nr:hypothetical protein [Candidatus Pacearchaeota archaeon]
MKKRRILASLPLVIMLFAFIYVQVFNQPILFCNDGTAINTCANIKPYFCQNGTLVEKSSICGCSDISVALDDKCISKYEIAPKKIRLDYTLRGEKSNIDFFVYKGLYNYLSKIPRYVNDSNPTLLDLKLKMLDEEQQRELLLPLVIEIINKAKTKEDQARIAISLVQTISFGNSDKTSQFGSNIFEYQRYPYEVLYDLQGICSEKSELLIFLLREIGYKTSYLYYNLEDHEATGIGCPKEESLDNTGYCFIETTGPSIITDNGVEYFGVTKLKSSPTIIDISEGISLGENFYEYKDARDLINIRDIIKQEGMITLFQHLRFKSLEKKYGLINYADYKF